MWAGGTLHIGLTMAVLGFAIFCLGFSGLRFFMEIDLSTALLLAFALSFSSTVFAVKILDENGRMSSLNGRTAIGILIIQDIVAVIYLTVSTGKAPLNKHADCIFERIRNQLKRFETHRRHAEETPFKRESWNIIIVGMGRVGTVAYDWFQERCGKVVIGLDFDQETVFRNSQQGRSVNQGDVTDPDFWRRLPAPDGAVKLVVLAVSNLDAMLYSCRMLKEMGYLGKIAAVVQYDEETEALCDAGADIAVNVYSEDGAGVAAHVYDSLPLKKR